MLNLRDLVADEANMEDVNEADKIMLHFTDYEGFKTEQMWYNKVVKFIKSDKRFSRMTLEAPNFWKTIKSFESKVARQID